VGEGSCCRCKQRNPSGLGRSGSPRLHRSQREDTDR
jgi:hypothetical protein